MNLGYMIVDDGAPPASSGGSHLLGVLGLLTVGAVLGWKIRNWWTGG